MGSSRFELKADEEREKVEIYESKHPYAKSQDQKKKIHFPGAKRIRVTFDPKCDIY